MPVLLSSAMKIYSLPKKGSILNFFQLSSGSEGRFDNNSNDIWTVSRRNKLFVFVFCFCCLQTKYTITKEIIEKNTGIGGGA